MGITPKLHQFDFLCTTSPSNKPYTTAEQVNMLWICCISFRSDLSGHLRTTSWLWTCGLCNQSVSQSKSL